jgi:AmmeMemoRadiSam system protein A
MPSNLSSEAKKELLALARKTIEERLKTGRMAESEPGLPELLEKRGAFVTLKKKGNLRGCIGNFQSRENLSRTIREMALAAAFEDPRFPPVTLSELSKIDIEISVLTPLQEVKDPREIKIGEDGIYITRGSNRGVFLPQVATEQGWDLETFLENCCYKAGLPGDAWEQKGTRIEKFQAIIFGEKP